MKDKAKSTIVKSLRQKAEDLLNKSLSTELIHSDLDIIKLIHKLDVYQIELEMQNEELLLANKKAELEADKYTNLYDFAPTGYFTLSKEGKILELNFSGATLLGKERSLLIEKKFGLFVSEQTKPLFNLFLKEVLEIKTKKSCELILNIDPFNPTYISVSGVINDDGNQVLISTHDISLSKKGEEAKKITDEKILQLSQVVEQSPVSIIITNTKGQIEYVNPKFIESSGYSKEEIIGENSQFLNSEHSTYDKYKDLWQTIKKGKNWKGEFNNKKKDGTLFWESATISPFVNEDGKTTHFIAITEDISQRKLAEKELITAKYQAEESDRLKLAFLANMSHEIRTPMNGILGFTALLKEPKLTIKSQLKYINIIEKSGIRMLNIINDIIRISKVESGQLEVLLTETNINESFETLYAFFIPETTKKRIQLIYSNKLTSEENNVISDNEKLYAIFTNLIKNAIKFTNEGTIEFGCEKKGKNIEFFVKDSGIGIIQSQQQLIFERFRQVNETVSRSHEGSGLGLAIAKAYIEILGGIIWVESEEGKGSSFYFTIPFDTEFIPIEKNIVKKENIENREENKINELKVLIVDDDGISKLLITKALKPYSKEIIKANSGIEAIKFCIKNPDIDLIMMDINMPEMDGYEATKRIRKFNKNIVIIAQTANAMQRDREEALKSGCTDYISKPINLNTLNELIQKYFKK
jgi:PAS domain S-box-containing protein